jgi:hypothetical protein
VADAAKCLILVNRGIATAIDEPATSRLAAVTLSVLRCNDRPPRPHWLNSRLSGGSRLWSF